MKKEIILALVFVTAFLMLVSTYKMDDSPNLEVTFEKVVETEYDYIYDLKVENKGKSALTLVNLELYYPKADQTGQKGSHIFKDHSESRHLLGIGSEESEVFQVTVHKDQLGANPQTLALSTPKVNIKGTVWHTIIPMGYQMSGYTVR